MKVAAYVRVSSENQEANETHQNQIAWLEAQAEANGWEMTLYTEPGISGEAISNRPKFQALLKEIKAGKYEAVAVKAIDRLCRSSGLSDWATIADTVKKAGIRIIAAGQNIDLRDPTQALVFTMLGPAIASYERTLIMSRTKDGRDRALREGRKPSGKDPLGLRYVKDERRFEIVEPEASRVRRMFELSASGLSTRKVKIQLAKEGITNRNGAPFNEVGILRILRNPAFKGEWTFKSGVLPVPPLVSVETWDRVQAVLAANTHLKGRPSLEVNPLRGIVFCEACGLSCATIRNRNRGGHFYLACTSRRTPKKTTYPRTSREPCGGVWDFHDVLGEVWSLAVRVLSEPGFIEAQEKAREKTGKAALDLAKEIEKEEATLTALLPKEKAATIKWTNGALSDAAYDHALATIATARKAAEGRLTELRSALAAESKSAAADAADLSILARYVGRLENLPDAERQAVLRAMCPVRGTHGIFLKKDGSVEFRGRTIHAGEKTLRSSRTR